MGGEVRVDVGLEGQEGSAHLPGEEGREAGIVYRTSAQLKESHWGFIACNTSCRARDDACAGRGVERWAAFLAGSTKPAGVPTSPLGTRWPCCMALVRVPPDPGPPAHLVSSTVFLLAANMVGTPLSSIGYSAMEDWLGGSADPDPDQPPPPPPPTTRFAAAATAVAAASSAVLEDAKLREPLRRPLVLPPHLLTPPLEAEDDENVPLALLEALLLLLLPPSCPTTSSGEGAVHQSTRASRHRLMRPVP